MKILRFRAIEFLFLVEAFQFSKFHQIEVKRDKGDFKRGLTVTLQVKNS